MRQQAGPPPVTRGRGRAFIIFFLFLLIAAGVGIYFWLQSRQFESTDDAEVEAHLNSISSRVDGAITHVYVDDNQIVKAGDPLVDLDPRDFQVAVDQARAQLAQARSQVTAQQPNVPIAQIESSTNITGAEADVANAEAAVGVAERDRESAAARLAEAQANAAKAQSRPVPLHAAHQERRGFAAGVRSGCGHRQSPGRYRGRQPRQRWNPRPAPCNSARPSLRK